MEARLLEVAGRVEPTQEAVGTLRALAQQVQSEKVRDASAAANSGIGIRTLVPVPAELRLARQVAPSPSPAHPHSPPLSHPTHNPRAHTLSSLTSSCTLLCLPHMCSRRWLTPSAAAMAPSPLRWQPLPSKSW